MFMKQYLLSTAMKMPYSVFVLSHFSLEVLMRLAHPDQRQQVIEF